MRGECWRYWGDDKQSDCCRSSQVQCQTEVVCRYDAEELDLSRMSLSRVPPQLRRCTRLRVLNLDMNKLRSLKGLPRRLEQLSAVGNDLTVVGRLPRSLRVAGLEFNRIHRIGAPLPPRLEALGGTYNFFSITAEFAEKDIPQTMTCLDLGYTNDPLTLSINSGKRAAAHRERVAAEKRKQAALALLSSCSFVQPPRAAAFRGTPRRPWKRGCCAGSSTAAKRQ